MVEQGKQYSLTDAVALLKQMPAGKFAEFFVLGLQAQNLHL